MYSLIPLLLIILSLLVIMVIVGRKFSTLANLDVNSIPEEKEAKFKEYIAGKRIKRRVFKWTSQTSKFFKKLTEGWSEMSERMYDRLKKIKEEEAEEVGEGEEKKEERINLLFKELEELDKKENFEKYESKLIEIIGLDSKNTTAFEELSELYFENKKYKESIQTYKHTLRLLDKKDVDKIAEMYFNLAIVYKESDKLSEAREKLAEALKLSPNNPRYLDTMLEISIMKEDKTLAKSTYDKLAEVNPENKKLEEWKKKIEEMD